jgi:hypothetical protein
MDERRAAVSKRVVRQLVVHRVWLKEGTDYKEQSFHNTAWNESRED